MDIGFNLTSDSSAFLGAFAQADQAVKGLSAETDALSNQSKEMFKASTKEVSGFTEAIKTGTKATGSMIEETKKAGQSVNIVKQLKQEIKFYTSEAAKAGPGTKAWVDNLAKAGKLKDELNDINAAVQSLNGNLGENFARAAGNSIGIVANGYEGLIATQSLLGVKAEEFEATLVKLQSLNAISKIAGEFGGLGDKIEEIKLGFSPVLDLFTNGAGQVASAYTSSNETLKSFFTNFSGNAKAAFGGAVDFVKNFGSNAASVAKNIGTGFVSFFTNFGSNMKSFAASAKAGINTVGAAIKSNPLGIILAGVTAVITAFVLLKDKVKPIADLFKFLGELWDSAVEKLSAIGEALGFIADEQERRAEATIKNTADEVAAIEKRYEREMKLATASGKETTKIEVEKAKATAKRIAETLGLLQAKAIKEGELNDEELKQQKELQEQLKDITIDAVAAQIKARTEAAKKQQEELKRQQDEAKRAADERLKLQQDLNNALADLLKKAQVAELEGLSGKEKIEMQKRLADQELILLRQTIEKKGKEYDKGFKFTNEQEAEFGKIQAEINRKYNNDILQEDIRLATERADLKLKELADSKAVVDGKQKLFDLELQLKEAEINLLEKNPGQSEADFEAIKQKALLELKKKGAQDSLQIRIAEAEAETAVLIAQAQKEIEIEKTKGKDADQAKISRLSASIEATKQIGNTQIALLISQNDVLQKEVDKQIDQIEKSTNARGAIINWAKLLGVNNEDLPKLKAAFDSLVSNAVTAFDQLNAIREQELQKELDVVQQKIDASNQLIDQRQSEIDNLKSQLDEEISLGEQGLANNVSRINREISAKEEQLQKEKAQRDKALQEEKKLQEEKAKLAKQQAIVDTVSQGSNLLTAASTLFAKGAFTGPVGIITAAATIAGMIATFLTMKNTLKAAGFAEGGYTGDGGKYDEAGVVHKGEYVMTKEKTNQNWDLLHGIHTNNIALMEAGIRELIKDKGISLSSDIAEGLANTKNLIRTNELKAFVTTDNSGLEEKVQTLDKRLLDLIKANENKHVVLPDGTQIITSGSYTKTIRPRKK